MTLPKISKNKILIIGLVIVAVVGYYMFRSSAPAPEPLTTAETGAVGGGVGQELVIELNRLRTLKNINSDIFKDPSFISYQDFTQTVVPQPIGRNNPFAPIGL